MRGWKSDSPIRYSERGRAAYMGKGRGRVRHTYESTRFGNPSWTLGLSW
jgi:hypothetical protein